MDRFTCIYNQILEATRRDFLKTAGKTIMGAVAPNTVQGIVSNIPQSSNTQQSKIKVPEFLAIDIDGGGDICRIYPIDGTNIISCLKQIAIKAENEFRDEFVDGDDPELLELNLQSVGLCIKDENIGIGSCSTSEETATYVIRSDNPLFKIVKVAMKNGTEKLSEAEYESIFTSIDDLEFNQQGKEFKISGAENNDDNIEYSRMDYAGSAEDNTYSKYSESTQWYIQFL